MAGTFALFDTPAGGLHLVYRPEGAQQDVHQEIPAAAVALFTAAQAGTLSMPDALKALKQMASGR